MKNKQYYSFGNPIKIRGRKHFCAKCGCPLLVIEHKVVVNSKSPEAQYYDFSMAVEGKMVGDCEFTHKVFRCDSCEAMVEPVTQIRYEDMLLTLQKKVNQLKSKGFPVTFEVVPILMSGDSLNGDLTNCSSFDIKFDVNGNQFTCNVPIIQLQQFERPYVVSPEYKKIICDCVNDFSK